MRTIKFRAWYKEKMYNYVEHTTYHDGSSACTMLHKDPDRAFGPESDHCILMQFTGLHYKNGVEIYEGDIVEMQWDKDDSEVGVIIYSGASFNVRLETDEYLVEIVKDALKYIGNLHENPELL